MLKIDCGLTVEIRSKFENSSTIDLVQWFDNKADPIPLLISEMVRKIQIYD